MISFVNAKLNLGLSVVRKREDGYHDLETIFIPAGELCGLPHEPGTLCDILEMVPAAADSFETLGADAGCPLEQNLVWRALQSFRRAFPEAQPVRIILDKRLPSGAGMGGGSADAGFALRMLNEINGSPLSATQLAEIARSLGADVPFFLYNRPCFATGIGERLTPLEIPQLRGKTALILKPSEGISTAQAFANITPHPAKVKLTEAIRLPIEQWRALIVNDFEAAMFRIHPHLIHIKEYLYGSGALYASMTGSGSAFFGIYADREAALSALEGASTAFATIINL
ncbi:MAG: 4-(cytidine 5'-diphospho)-2-C-methyl-D-erythritol kinase [Bacteroidales bacterium]|nr:4-(cytidine 5'-diphospho)-2-C-methyl-D-erythritol kinase [Bacteroidales bacterium]